jgi:hypothetical protein
MDNIIFNVYGALGDEMHMTRNCILDLLNNNYITNDVVIYCGKDRNFLYENIFTNIFYHEDFTLETVKLKCLENFGKEFTIVVPKNIHRYPIFFWTKYGSYENILDKKIRITNNNIFNYHKINYYNSKNHSDEFKKLVTNINYLEVLPKFNNETFIVYHHRFKNNLEWDQKKYDLDIILKNQNNHNLVIFSQCDLDYLNCNQKIYFTKNLKEYASFIHSKNCLAVISVWSGGGQLASYCSSANTKLIMYFEKCQEECLKIDKCQEERLTKELYKWINSENAFDFAQFTDVKRFFIKKYTLEKYLKHI